MQIPEDLEALPESGSKKRRDTPPLLRLMRRNHNEDETVRLPLSALAFWSGSVDSDLDTVQVGLKLPNNLDDEETLAGPLARRG